MSNLAVSTQHNPTVNHNVNTPASLMGLIREQKKGAMVFNVGQNANKLFRLVDGLVAIGGIDEQGEETFMHFVYPGEFFGIETILEQGSHVNFALVLSMEAKVEEFSMSFVSQELVMEEVMRGSFMRRLTRVQKTLLLNANGNLRARLIEVLKDIAEGVGVKLLNGEVLVRTHLKHRELALLCNATRQSITTLLKSLSKEGLLKTDRNSMLLSDVLING